MAKKHWATKLKEERDQYYSDARILARFISRKALTLTMNEEEMWVFATYNFLNKQEDVVWAGESSFREMFGQKNRTKTGALPDSAGFPGKNKIT